MKKVLFVFVISFLFIGISCVKVSGQKDMVIDTYITTDSSLINEKNLTTKLISPIEKSPGLCLQDSTLFSDDWKKAEASYYYPSRMKNSSNGHGLTGRKIKSGSIALGSSFFKENLVKKGLIVFIEIKDCNIVTPYGKGIFRVDDGMGRKYNLNDKFFIDFFHKDVSPYNKRMGRFKVLFRVYKVITPPANKDLLAGFSIYL